MSEPIEQWEFPDDEPSPDREGRENPPAGSKDVILYGAAEPSQGRSSFEKPRHFVRLWNVPELRTRGDIANLDDQIPATLFYLGRILRTVPSVSEVYVEELEHGRRKHWAVLEERDYEAMDDIYDIEKDTLRRFPASDLSFRVTVASDEGPSISSDATKIYDRQQR